MGGETKNIDEIAGIISSRIFDELGWQCQTTTDISWDCCLMSHLSSKQQLAENPKKTHPTDVVFKYKDPYSDEAQYIQTDLKSYCAKTIEGSRTILSTIRSLSQQVECAPRNSTWKKYFWIAPLKNSTYMVCYSFITMIMNMTKIFTRGYLELRQHNIACQKTR